MKEQNPPRRRSRSLMVAMVLGTALTAMDSRSSVRADSHVVQDISRYCQACWRNARLPADVWPDCTQEVFTRLLERVEPDRWDAVLKPEANERREFVRAIDTVKKRSQRRKKWASLPGDVGENRAPSAITQEWENVEHASRQVLSDRQQRIIAMSRDGWSIPEIAEELNTTPDRVSDEKYKAIRKLKQHFGVNAIS